MDTSIPVQERAASMKTYADAFGFWMIGVVDPDGTISSTLRPKTGKVQRGYIPRIMASGKREISDPFPAGATGDMTYSQFMPIKKDGKVVSICFVTTPLSLLSERVTRRDHTGNGYYLMLSSTGSLIAHPNPAMSLTHIRDHVAGERFLYGSSRETFLRDIKSDQPGTFISIFRNTLYFTAFMNIPETGFTQTLLYTLLFVVLYRYGAYRHFAGTQAGGQHPAASRRAEQKRQCRRQHHGRGCVQHHQHQPQRVVRRPYRAAYAQPLPASGSTTPSKRCRAGYSGSSSSTWTTLRPSTTISGMRRAIRPSGASPRPQRIHGTPLRAGLPLRGRRIRPVHPAGHTFRCFRPSPELLETQHGSIVGNDVVYAYGTSIGVSFYPLSGTFDEALHMADTALYSSKRSGKGTFTCLPSHAEWL